MAEMEKAIAKEKKVEFWIGVLFLLPAILGALSFIWCLWFCPDSYRDFGGSFAGMRSLKGIWDDQYNSSGGVAASPAPIFCGLMALAGAYLVKDSLRYLFINTEPKEEPKPEEPKLETDNG